MKQLLPIVANRWSLWRYLNCQYQPISFKLDHVLELYLRCVHHGRVAWPAENRPVLSLLFMSRLSMIYTITFWKFDLYIFVRYVRFICMRLDWYLYGSTDICVSSIYLYGSIDMCKLDLMYAVRFIFVRLDWYLWKFDLKVCGSI